MRSKRSIYFPAQFSIDGKVFGNPIRQLRRPDISDDAEVQPYRQGRTSAELVIGQDGVKTLVVARTVSPPADVDDVLLVPGGSVPIDAQSLLAHNGKARWLAPKPARIIHADPAASNAYCARVRASWRDQFFFRQERYENGEVVDVGLRSPQVGALHAALAHWTVTCDPATIVMPTGTGKTETMLALLVNQRLERLLVVVPTAALRDQIALKFVTLGILKPFGVIGCNALYPVVGTLEHRPRTPEDVEAYFSGCNVVVTTMGVVGGCDGVLQRKIADLCSHLFIDEAHHISAPTWNAFRRFFPQKPILQFTATPFRNDGKHIDGTIIFNYPLRKAQDEGYFKVINFRPVRAAATKRADELIAQAAVQQLEQDKSGNLNHIVMARASTIERAKQIYEIYQRSAAAHRPLLIHSKQSAADRRAALQQLRDGLSRVVVCVDMLGEGFDLPELKIAALHDMHKSLAITLQFTGRFTRTKSGIGQATVIANIAAPDVEEALRDLYAEDADWNHLLRYLSEGATGRQVRRSAFLDGFADAPIEIPLQNVFPKMSTVVYHTFCATWRPEKVQDAVNERRLYAGPTQNQRHKILLFVTRERDPIPWGDIKDLYNTVWDLYVLHWDAQQKLLFIHSSNNDSLHEDIAKAVAGDDVELIRGERIFRSLHGINRLLLMNLGLNHSLSRAVRFTMYMGADIQHGLSEAHYQNKIKSNLFGRGFENGEKASVGCSYKGRVWSHRIAYDISDWVDWCRAIGAKLLDDRISVKEIFAHVIVPEQIQERPTLVPLTIEWPEDVLQRSEDAVELNVAGEVVPFFDVGMDLVDHHDQGPLRFRIFTETKSVEYEVTFRANSVEYVPTGRDIVEIVAARKRKSLSDWFQKEPPVLRFEDGAYLVYNELFKVPRGNRIPFDKERIDAWDWSGVNLKKESQTHKRYRDSVQYRVIQHLLRPEHDPRYDIVFDDDDAREAADVVAIKIAGDRLIVHFFHCKYSAEASPGARVDDLYAVCGQAQRSVYWKADVRGLIDHLRCRDESRVQRHGVSRFERGNAPDLDDIARQVPFLTPEFRIFIVQPGLSKNKIETSQLDLLAVTELYLQETYAIALGVIANK